MNKDWVIVYFEEAFPEYQFQIYHSKEIVQSRYGKLIKGMFVAVICGKCRCHGTISHVSESREYLENNFKYLNNEFLKDRNKPHTSAPAKNDAGIQTEGECACHRLKSFTEGLCNYMKDQLHEANLIEDNKPSESVLPSASNWTRESPTFRSTSWNTKSTGSSRPSKKRNKRRVKMNGGGDGNSAARSEKKHAETQTEVKCVCNQLKSFLSNFSDSMKGKLHEADNLLNNNGRSEIETPSTSSRTSTSSPSISSTSTGTTNEAPVHNRTINDPNREMNDDDGDEDDDDDEDNDEDDDDVDDDVDDVDSTNM